MLARLPCLRRYDRSSSARTAGRRRLRDRVLPLESGEKHVVHEHPLVRKLETQGLRLTDEELTGIDLVMLGIKAWDPDRHRHLTGMDIEPTLEFARRLASQKRKIWIRFVLVPGLTDDREDVAGIARFAAGRGNVERVEVLPFHQMGKFKWERLGLEYTLSATQPPSAELAEQTCAIFRAEGLKAY